MSKYSISVLNKYWPVLPLPRFPLEANLNQISTPRYPTVIHPPSRPHYTVSRVHFAGQYPPPPLVCGMYIYMQCTFFQVFSTV
jgi:hypothetical protein